METSPQDLAAQIEAGTKQIVEGSGNEYKSTVYVDEKHVSTETERDQLSTTLSNQIKDGTEKDKEYNAWYEKEYGKRNQHIASNTSAM